MHEFRGKGERIGRLRVYLPMALNGIIVCNWQAQGAWLSFPPRAGCAITFEPFDEGTRGKREAGPGRGTSSGCGVQLPGLLGAAAVERLQADVSEVQVLYVLFGSVLRVGCGS